jgi:serine/threonine-protein kinase
MNETPIALGSSYRLTERIGVGVTGAVWRGIDLRTQTPVAAKLLHPQFVANTEVVDRFIRERTILTDLQHPNIVSVLDLVVEGERLAIVMELMAGGSLSSYLKRTGPLSTRDAVAVTRQVLAALDYAHSQNVLHRDIKPDNVMMVAPDSPDQVKLGDFGVAGLVGSTVQATGLVGTPLYMPPELLRDEPFSPASDIYGVGIMLYELLTGVTPFAGPGAAMTILMRHLNSLPPKPPIGDRLWAILEQVLAKQPENRPTAAELITQLNELPEDALSGSALPVQPVPTSWEKASSIAPEEAAAEKAAAQADPDSPVGATIVKRRLVKDGSGSGDAEAAQPGADGANGEDEEPIDPNATMAARRVPAGFADAVAQAVSPAPTQQDSGKKRKILLIVGVAVVVIALATVFLVRYLGRGAQPQTPAATPKPDLSTTQTAGPDYATGLQLTYEASGKNGEIDVAFTEAAPKSVGLNGQILIAFPANGDGSCPVIGGDDANQLTAISAANDKIDFPCAYKTTVKLDAAANKEIDFNLTQIDWPSDLNSWLKTVLSQTDAALKKASGTAFALQRIQSISATAKDVQYASSPTVSYEVDADFGDNSSDASNVLFTGDTLSYQATDLLKELTGGKGLDAVKVTSCQEALVVSNRITALQPNPNCYVDVQIGDLDTGQSNFAINMAPS